jgi:hypothetical protein
MRPNQLQLLPEDMTLLNKLMKVLDVSDPAHPEDLRHWVIRKVISILVRIPWL